MACRFWWPLSLILLIGWTAATAQESVLPGGEQAPVLRLETSGPTAQVTALAFSPDGRKLYAVGADKLVRAWSVEKGRYAIDKKTSYRVPVGPGLHGLLAAVAVSPDGNR